MPGGQHSLKATAYRRRAAMCGSHPACAQSGDDRTQLLRMCDSRLSRAANEDWLGDLPPAKTLALPR